LPSSRIHEICGQALPVRGNDIDTDRIIPARFLKSVSFDGLERHLFQDEQDHAVSNPAYASARIMLVNANFGCGSSREHAPQAIYRRGIRAVVGESFSEIFFGNAVALGMPCPTASRETLDALMALVEQDPATEIAVDLDAMRVTVKGRAFDLSLPPAARGAFLDGSWDATGLLLEQFDDVRGVAARLPYVTASW
jgi:3-isopropylmalate/(R)-2-methylmalate dehydratase small subunit